MTRQRKGAKKSSSHRTHPVPRTARLNELIRQIVADELTEIGDERLEHVSITAVEADAELYHAVVWFDSYTGEAGDAEVLEAFAQRRVRLQRAIGDQMRARRTPVLDFKPDEVLRSAQRIDALLRETRPAGDTPTAEPEAEDGDDRP